MADNVTADPGSGGATFKTDEDTGASAHVPVTKIELGTNGTFSGYVAQGNPMPIEVRTPNGDSAMDETNDAVNVNVVAGAISAQTDDSAFTVASGEGVVIMGLADETATDSVDEGDAGAVRMSLDRRLLVDAQIAGQDADVTIADGGNSITVDGTITANLGATDNAVLDQIEVNTSYGDQTGGGTETGALRVTLANNSTGLISVDDNGGSLTVDSADLSTIAGAVAGTEMQVDIVSGSVGVTGTVTVDLGANNDVVVAGDVAHDAADSGNPTKIGARATNSIEGRTQVANNDRTDLLADLNGVQLSRPHTTLEEIITERVSDTGGTSTAFTNFAAGGAGVHNYVTTISIYNSSATDGYVDFRDGTGGSVIFTAAAPAAGGSVINFPIPLKGAANTALAYDVSGPLSTVYISAVGFQAQG